MSEQSKQLFPGKIAIVTEGRRRIGRNAVESLAKRGVQAIFTYSQPETRCGSGCCRREGCGSGSERCNSMPATSLRSMPLSIE